MRTAFFFVFAVLLNKSFAQPVQSGLSQKYVLVIHGGAGTILRSQMSPEREAAYRQSLDRALSAGQQVLARGGRAIDAVEMAVRVLEDDPLFNAGKGSVFTHDGQNEMDAAIMNGQTLAAGSVAGVHTIRNPITAARAVMEKSAHVMLTGSGAETFAREQGLDIVDPLYFYAEDRWKSLLKARELDSLAKRKWNSMAQRRIDSLREQVTQLIKEKEAAARELDSLRNVLKLIKNQQQVKQIQERIQMLNQQEENGRRQLDAIEEEMNRLKKQLGTTRFIPAADAAFRDYKYGTVGAVALDKDGHLAAATSTGGMTNKRFGRVGDAPVIGAGTYANDATAAISGTGWGEYFIRLVMAKTISDRMEFGNQSLQDAAQEMVMKVLPALGGDGGVIAVDRHGNIAMPFCTEGMYRGYVNSDGAKEIRIYKD